MWKRAAERATTYRQVIISEHPIGFIGWTKELPLVMAGGETEEECKAALLEATTVAIAYMEEKNAYLSNM